MVNSNTKVVNHPWHANLILFACLCQRKWKVALCNQISQQWQRHIWKKHTSTKHITGKESSTRPSVKGLTWVSSSAVETNLILLIKTLPCCAIKLVCLQEFLDHLPPLNTCTHTKESTALSLKKFAFLVKKPLYE